MTSLLEAIYSSATNAVFFVIIITMFFFAFIAANRSKKQPAENNTLARRYLRTLPTNFATVGILGTFIGAMFATSEAFDVLGKTTNVTEGVKHILRGISIAMTTSIMGMISGLVARIWLANGLPDLTKKETTEASDTSETKPSQPFVNTVIVNPCLGTDGASKPTDTESGPLQEINKTISKENKANRTHLTKKITELITQLSSVLREDRSPPNNGDKAGQ